MWRRIEAGEYRGTCEGVPRYGGQSKQLCKGVSSRDLMRGRRALWVWGVDHRMCGSCKRTMEQRMAA
jgi:hypothetical protein